MEYLKHNKPTGSISFLLTSDEEGDATYGTKMMLDHIKNNYPSIDFCILGEPTNINKIGDTVKIGRRGSVNFDLIINGKQGHVAYPQKAINPLPIVTKILNELSNIQLDNGTEYFQPSNLELTSIDVDNDVTNIIPESVKAKFNIRFNNLHTADDLYIKINNIIQKYSQNFSLNYKSSSEPFIQQYSSQMQAFVKIIHQESGNIPKIETNGGTSDARFIHSHAPVLEFGLNCNFAHKINENCKISDLQTLYNVYYKSLIVFL